MPAGFDASGFLRAAKMNFLKLQAANDNGRLEDIREFTTDELYAELKNDLARRSSKPTWRGSRPTCSSSSPRATGTGRACASPARCAKRRAPSAEAFTEVWNLVKPADGSSGWLLAGIQQMH